MADAVTFGATAAPTLAPTEAAPTTTIAPPTMAPPTAAGAYTLLFCSTLKTGQVIGGLGCVAGSSTCYVTTQMPRPGCASGLIGVDPAGWNDPANMVVKYASASNNLQVQSGAPLATISLPLTTPSTGVFAAVLLADLQIVFVDGCDQLYAEFGFRAAACSWFPYEGGVSLLQEEAASQSKKVNKFLEQVPQQ